MNEFSFPRSPQRRSSGRQSPPILFLCLVCFLGASSRQASADEFSKISNYSVHLVRGTVMVDTRVGDVNVEGWDKDRVEVKAEKVVRAGSEKESRRLFDRITVRLIPDEEGRTILVKVFYPPRRLWRPFRGESRLSVNFHIKMPNDSNLELKCVDGDITVRGVTGNEHLKVNYGNVEIDVPSVWDLRLLRAHTWLGYVQSDLHTLTEQDAGVGRSVSFVNPQGRQEIRVHVRMGGVWIYGNQP